VHESYIFEKIYENIMPSDICLSFTNILTQILCCCPACFIRFYYSLTNILFLFFKNLWAEAEICPKNACQEKRLICVD